MDAMPKYRPPFLLRDVSRHGKVRWYYRKGKAKVRLPDFGTVGFQEAYEAAASGKPVPVPTRGGKGTLEWLIRQYMESTAWAGLSVATRKQRGNIFRHVITKAGKEAFEDVTAKAIEKAMDDRAETPDAARNFLESMRGLFRWAKKAEHVETDPTAALRAHRRRTEGFPVWTEDDCAAYEARWPLGSKERLAYVILACTGLRRGDAAILGRQHAKDGILTMRTEKTGEVVTIPILPAMLEAIEAGPCGDLTFVVNSNGKGFTKESFGNWFHDACRAAGIEKSAHGLRKLAATRLANAGATVAQLEAWFGWRGGGMASLYTRAADRKRLAYSAASLLSHPQSGETFSPQATEKKGA